MMTVDLMARTAQTSEASTVHKPFGKPGGKGLWGTGEELPAYIQSVAHHLVTQGMDRSRAIGEAKGIVANWAKGHDGHGHPVHPDVQAAASKAIAEWERLRAKAHADNASRTDDMTDIARQAGPAEYFRTYDLEDIRIVSRAQGDSTGRLVEAYAAAFGQVARISDHQGRYDEENDPGAFNDRIAELGRSRGGLAQVKVMYNHALTIHGTPSERGSVAVAVPKEIRADSKGLLTRSLYLDTPFAEEILEGVRAGAYTAQSYTGAIIASSPELRPGERYRPRGGKYPLVRRMKLGLREYGPTPFPAFTGAEIVGVRMSLPGSFEDDPGLFEEEDDPDATRADEDAGQLEPPTQSHGHRLWVLRNEELCRSAGITLPRRENA